MRVFNEDKTEELKEYDLFVGYLEQDVIINHIPEQLEVQEVSHEHIIAEYPNGGKEVEIIIDVPYKPYVAARDEEENILVYKKYTQKEIDTRRIDELKGFLLSTDHKAIKYAEGVLSIEDYEPIKKQRQKWRDEINQLEEKIK